MITNARVLRPDECERKLSSCLELFLATMAVVKVARNLALTYLHRSDGRHLPNARSRRR